ncbi:MAG: SDR family oxidoreductase [Deinococcus sp.]|nr:SDR family oxidoreductase [Deinococcus sp.]
MKTLQELLDLSGKVALVSGGAGWLGTPMCEGLAEAGARVVVASRDLAKCQALADRLPGKGHVAMALDISSDQSVCQVVGQAAALEGHLDVLINNAYSGPRPNIGDATAQDFAESFHNGVTSYFIAAQQAHQYMRHTGGSIINIASMYGLVASYPEVYVGYNINSPPNYHAAKGALIHLTRHLAAYWARDGIRVNTISPGPFPPDRISSAMPDFIPRLEAKVPMGRIGQRWEVKGAAVFLASQMSSYITGQNIVVDGGWTIW